MTLKQYNAIRSQAAKIKNWYLVDGLWTRLTQSEMRQAVRYGKSIRRATVDEELEKDGI